MDPVTRRRPGGPPAFRRAPGMALLLAGALALLGACSSGSGQPLDGTWNGFINSTYYCESASDTIQFDIDGSTLTITGGSGPFVGWQGTVKPSGYAYQVTLVDDSGTPFPGALLMDERERRGALAIYDRSGSTQGYVGVVQKGDLASATYALTDLAGTWAGATVRVDSAFNVTSVASSTVKITNTGNGLALSGSDGDGSFAGTEPAIALDDTSIGLYVSGWSGANTVDWANSSYDALYGLSTDKDVLAAGFLTSVCDQMIFQDLPSQKFTLWTRQ
jgi:hypothetical protein